MTRQEFDQWWTEYATVFPGTAAWLNGVGIDKPAIKSAWASALHGTALVDAKEVTRRMVSGELEAVAGYDRELTAAKVRSHAEAIRQERHCKSLPAAPEPIKDRRDFQHGVIFAGLKDLRKRGASEAEQAAWIASLAVEKDDPMRGPRFNCGICCDSGQVEIAHAALVQAYRLDGIEAAHRSIYRIMTVRCNCQHGTRGGPDNKEPRYRPDVHCRVIGADTESAAFWERFERWLAEAEAESEASRDSRNAWKPAQQEAFR